MDLLILLKVKKVKNVGENKVQRIAELWCSKNTIFLLSNKKILSSEKTVVHHETNVSAIIDTVLIKIVVAFKS